MQLKTWHLYTLVLLGTLVRVVYGLHFSFWKASPDHLAWELCLAENFQQGLHYKYLMHYPHEGGSFLIGLIALPFRFISPGHSLLMASLLLETLFRLIQLRLSQRLFGERVAFFFALWTVISIPLLLPWGLQSAGLHSLASVFTFVLLWLLSSEVNRWKTVKTAALCAVAISFCYDSVVLVFPAILFFIIQDIRLRTFRNSPLFAGTLIICLIPHLLLRLYADAGFHLAQSPDLFQIRGLTENNLMPGNHWERFRFGITEVLPASFFLSVKNQIFNATGLKYFVFISILAALPLAFFEIRRKQQTVPYAWLIIFLFLVVYSVSPYLELSATRTNYVYYRHLAYIVPLLMLMLIQAFNSIPKAGLYIIPAWLAMNLYLNICHVSRMSAVRTESWRSAGWILAGKFGHDPEQLLSMHQHAAKENKDELMRGFGWGLCTHLLTGKPASDSLAAQQLISILEIFPVEDQTLLKEGLKYAFQPEQRPVLDRGFMPLLHL